MNCKSCHQQLLAYADSELPVRAREAVDMHLSSCRSCAEALKTQRAALAIVDALPGLEPSASFDVDFERKLRLAEAEAETREERKRARWRWPALATLTAGAFAILLAVTVLKSTPPASRSHVAGISDLQVAADLELVQNYQVVNNLDGLEDFDLVSVLDGLLEGGDTQ